MPGRDGTGPLGRGPRQNGPRGPLGAGPAGYCVCPKCGEKTTHTVGMPCTSMKCPKCGTAMIRGT